MTIFHGQKEVNVIPFYYHPTPNPNKIALFLEESGLAYEIVPVDTSKGEQHAPTFRAINPNGKVPAIIDTEGVGGEARVFDSGAILLYLGDKIGRFTGAPADRPEVLASLQESVRWLATALLEAGTTIAALMLATNCSTTIAD